VAGGREVRRTVAREAEPTEDVGEVLGQHARTLPWRGAVVIAIALLLASCGAASRRQPTRPSQATVAAIESAEEAEKRRDHEVARQRYTAAIAAAPDLPSERFARHEFAETLLSWGEIDGGREQLERVVAIAPDDAAAWHDLGLVRHHLADNAGAIDALLRARDLRAKDPRPRISLAVLYWKLGRLDHALAEYVALAKLELPDRLATKVQWAIGCLSAPGAPPAGCPKVTPAP
jgi:Flp pilus assembly protein TadD